ncbi:hypothetical protein RND71_025288 [Anisodus tanguticus]|uniref:Uncharacterized protein n=1 Tax=Anisodus tanguticus TaxID=243964 RepID=A0AAE1V5N2_9SOLA|nr:hypothetical protein RND71_025288 [Anisodus tanguticus]
MNSKLLQKFPSTVAFRLYEVLRMHDSFTGNMSDALDIYRFGAGINSCDLLAVRSCSEFESEWLHVLEEIHHKPVFPVGQLSPLTIDNSDDEKNNACIACALKAARACCSVGSVSAKPCGWGLWGVNLIALIRWTQADTDHVCTSRDLPGGGVLKDRSHHLQDVWFFFPFHVLLFLYF